MFVKYLLVLIAVAAPAIAKEAPIPDFDLAQILSAPEFPQGFYDEKLQPYASLYHENTVSVRTRDERTLPWRDLSAGDFETAKKYSIATQENNSQPRVLVGSSETDKYYQFVWADHHRNGITYLLYSRVFKESWIDRSDSDREGDFLGTLKQKSLTAAAARNVVEYLWYYEYYNRGNFATLESTVDETADAFLIRILAATKSYYSKMIRPDEYCNIRYANVYAHYFTVSKQSGNIFRSGMKSVTHFEEPVNEPACRNVTTN